jgi:ketosteroid isomerase-like protein
MSSENVALTRSSWDAFIRGDLDAVFEYFAEDIEWDTTTFEGWPEVGVYRGHPGVRKFFEDWVASWERFEAGVDDVVDVGDDRVVVLAWQRGYGPGSHAPVEMEWAQICTLRDGLCVRIEVWSDRGAALESVGLRASS